METVEQYIERAKVRVKGLRENFVWVPEPAGIIDQTLLKPEASLSDVRRFFEESLPFNFASICVNSSFIPYLRELNREVPLCSVVGFPLGASSFASKAFEADDAVRNGAVEIDMVMNIGFFKDRDYKKVERDIKMVRNAIGEAVVLKVIIETGFLSNDEKVEATKIVMNSGADFVKTSTGFGPGGATLFDVALLKEVVGDQIKVKAAGGIRNYYTLCALFSAGASRIGTSSGTKILNEV